jgi:hypothetical protein
MSLRCKEEPPAEHSDDGRMGQALDFLAKFSGTSFDTLVADSTAAEPDDASATLQNHFGREWQRLEDAADDTECSGDEVKAVKAEEEVEEEEEKAVVVPPWRCIPVGAGSASRADPVGAGSASRAADPRGRASASSKELWGVLKARLVEEKKDVAVAAAGAAAVAVAAAAAAAAEEVPRSGSGSGSSSVTAVTCRPESKPSAFNYGPGTGEHAMDDKGKIQRFFGNGHLTFLMIVLRSRMRQCLKLVFPSFKFELLSFFCSDNGHLTFLMARRSVQKTQKRRWLAT